MEPLDQQLAALTPEQRRLVERLLHREQALQTAAPTPSPTQISHEPTRDTYPLSFAQQRLWFLGQIQPGDPAYYLAHALRLRGTLDLAALRQSLALCGDRHRGGRGHPRLRSRGRPGGHPGQGRLVVGVGAVLIGVPLYSNAASIYMRHIESVL